MSASVEQDLVAAQKAISDAVTITLSSDDFAKACALHLAAQLQNTLKSALDISKVEERLSKRLDEIQTTTSASLADLSNALNNSESTNKISALGAAVTQVNALLETQGKDVEAVMKQITRPNTSKLDSIANDLKILREKGPAPIGLALASVSTKLDALAAELKAMQR